MNGAPERAGAKYVLYWAQMNRRVDSNHGLAYAIHLANRRGLPVLVYEGLTCAYPYASDRLHTFILEGVPETARRLGARGIGYNFYLRKRRSDANDTLYKLAAEAAIVVSDDYPTFIAAGHNASVPAKIGVPYNIVDSSCIVPMSLLEKREYAAYTIRPKIRRLLGDWLKPVEMPAAIVPFTGPRPAWHTDVTETNIAELVAECDIDHTVGPSISVRGGRLAAEAALHDFVANKLSRYAEGRNEPSARVTSGMSPYLHFGQISSLELALATGESPEYLEELIVRRELAFNFARFTPKPDSLDNLPDWTRATLAKHDGDKRDYIYTREQFEQARTHDALWNACQKEMLLDGRIHGYYRMYWGKKIIEWSASHAEALDTMVYLHDRYALDGRDPNTYTNILWCFGLHDRPWGERPVFGMIRYMSYDGMKRKTNIGAYINQIDALAGSPSALF